MTTVPDEVMQQAIDAAVRAMNCHPAEASRYLGSAVEAAAPIIARAAAALTLRGMANELDETYRRMAPDCGCYPGAADELRERADTLEANS